MSTLNVWLVGLICYLVGAIVGLWSEENYNCKGFTCTTVVLGFVVLLILIGVKIGGAA